MEFTNDKKRTIDGSYCACTKVIGYCHCKLHKGCLTAKLMREHECVQKGCNYFEKHEEAIFWQTKQKNKEVKQQAKAERKQRESKERGVLDAIRTHTSGDDCFFAIRAELSEDMVILHYIKYGWIDIPRYVYEFSTLCGTRIYLKEIKATAQMKREILFAQKLK